MSSAKLDPNSCHRLFGFTLEKRFDLGVDLPVAPGPPDVQLVVRFAAQLEPTDADLVYASEPARGSGAGVTAYQANNRAIIRFRDVDEFRIDAHLIECVLLSPDYEYLVPIQFLGIVMALWMELRGFPVLHASGVEVNGDGVAFMAAKRGGKTSLSAAMVTGNHRFLSDDLVTLEVEADNRVLVRPAYPQFRMEPDLASHFVDGWDGLPIVHPDHEKRRVPLSLLGESQVQPVPLRRIYFPERLDDGPIDIAPIRGADALIELLRGSFLPEMVAGFGLESQRLGALGTVARAVPFKRLRYPSGFDKLPEVRAAIEEDMRL